MSGRHDPTQITIFPLDKADIRTKVKAISTSHMVEDWAWGLEPYRRCRMAPFVSTKIELNLSLPISGIFYVGLPTSPS